MNAYFKLLSPDHIDDYDYNNQCILILSSISVRKKKY